MFYITESGRIVDKQEKVGSEDYIPVNEYPTIPKAEGKIGVIVGIDKEKNTPIIQYNDLPVDELDDSVYEMRMESKLDYIAMKLK